MQMQCIGFPLHPVIWLRPAAEGSHRKHLWKQWPTSVDCSVMDKQADSFTELRVHSLA